MKSTTKLRLALNDVSLKQRISYKAHLMAHQREIRNVMLVIFYFWDILGIFVVLENVKESKIIPQPLLNLPSDFCVPRCQFFVLQ